MLFMFEVIFIISLEDLFKNASSSFTSSSNTTWQTACGARGQKPNEARRRDGFVCPFDWTNEATGLFPFPSASHNNTREVKKSSQPSCKNCFKGFYFEFPTPALNRPQTSLWTHTAQSWCAHSFKSRRFQLISRRLLFFGCRSLFSVRALAAGN